MLTSAPLLAAAFLAAGSVSMRAEPKFLVGGSGDETTIEITATDDHGAPHPGPLTLSSDAGRLDAPRSTRPGTWVVTLHAPAEKYPQLAFVLAQFTGGPHAWLALPIHGATELNVETSKPHATVQVAIAGQTFGPVPTDAKGQATLPVIVPPGVTTGSATSKDRLGNKKTVPVDLKPPPLRRVALAALGGTAAASWSDPRPLPLGLFAAEPDGSPARKGQPKLRADQGAPEAVRADGPGRWLAGYRAPDLVGTGSAKLTAQLPGSGADDELEIKLLPGPAARVEIALEPDQFTAGSGASPRVVTRVFDARGNPRAPDEAQVEVDFGSVSPERAWRLPDAFANRSEALARARVPGAQAEARLRLNAAPPSSGELELDRGRIHAGGSPAHGTVRLRDPFGNPTPGLDIDTTATIGRVAALRDEGRGEYRFELRAAREHTPGRSQIALRPAGSTLVLERPIEVLPPDEAWATALGAMLWGSTNVADPSSVRTFGVSASAELTVRAGLLPIELAADVGYHGVTRRSENVSDQYPSAATLTAHANELSIAGLARWVIPWKARVDWTLGAGGGMRVSRAWVGVGGENLETSSNEDTLFAGQLLFVGGARVRVGPGRFVAELQHGWMPLKGDPNNAITGDLGGLGLALGYLFDL